MWQMRRERGEKEDRERNEAEEKAQRAKREAEWVSCLSHQPTPILTLLPLSTSPSKPSWSWYRPRSERCWRQRVSHFATTS